MSDKKPNNPPAFPPSDWVCNRSGDTRGYEGMTLRDWFATAVIGDIISAKSPSLLKQSYDGASNILRDDCRLAYKISDALLEARENKY